MALRWKKNPRPTGLAAVGAGPRGSKLNDGAVQYASVSAMRSGIGSKVTGWYFVAGWDSDIPHFNSCGSPVPDEATAKEQAMAYVRKHLSGKQEGGEGA